MVRKEINTRVWFFCEKCHTIYDTEEEAKKCEEQEPTKVSLKGSYFFIDRSTKINEVTDWKKGDLCIVRIHDDWKQWRLAMIVEEVVSPPNHEHKIYPKFKYIDMMNEDNEGDLFSFGWKHEEVILLDDNVKKRVLEWADILRG